MRNISRRFSCVLLPFLWNWERETQQLTTNVELYGLLGHPLGHSFSAAYFTEKFAREVIDARYENFDFASVPQAMERLSSEPDLRGFNVTIPHKRAVMPFLTSLSPEAEAIGAVNVVCVRQGADGRRVLHGCNSDAVGFARSIKPLLRPGEHTAALVLGTGGASLAVLYALHRLGLRTLSVSRTPQEGQAGYGDLTEEVMDSHPVVVNCTPLGMHPKTEACPDIPYHLLTSRHLLYDLVYNPEETLFMRRGRERGATVKNGLEMLRLQAEAAWEMWHGEWHGDGDAF